MKKVLLVFITLQVLGVCGILLVFQNDPLPHPDVVAVNDMVMTAMQSEDKTEASKRLTFYLQREFKNIDEQRINRDWRMQIYLFIYLSLSIVAGVWLCHYCQWSILRPFRKLQEFSQNIAMGNLDIPLEMDRHGRFGAFTESFDLMREELNRARENERNANRSKKELVASLSHDIKTPVASIQAATELMLVNAKNEKEKVQLERISAKAEQINLLINDMFHATLKELQELSVTVTEICSTQIPSLLQNADYREKIKGFTIPSCIILADTNRLQQIFDNIIGNSYKYADTEMEIRTAFSDKFLVIDIIDFGKGVPDDELPLLLNKFYRGKNAEEKSGYGMGLYISSYLLHQMSGALRCENYPGSFVVRLTLRLAG